MLRLSTALRIEEKTAKSNTVKGETARCLTNLIITDMQRKTIRHHVLSKTPVEIEKNDHPDGESLGRQTP